MNEALRTRCQVVQTSITLGEWDSAIHNKTGAEALIWPESDTRGIFKISSKKNSLCFRAPPLLENETLCLTWNPTSISSTPNTNRLQDFLILNTVVIFLPIKKGTLVHSPVLLLGLATSFFFFGPQCTSSDFVNCQDVRGEISQLVVRSQISLISF